MYFCLKSSIFKGESTRLSNLPIWVNLKTNWQNPIDKEWYERMVEESSREKKYMFKENVNSIEINVCNSLWYLNEDFLKISQERRWVGVTCILEKGEGVYVCDISEIWRLGKNEETISLFTLYREQKRSGIYPALNVEGKRYLLDQDFTVGCQGHSAVWYN